MVLHPTEETAIKIGKITKLQQFIKEKNMANFLVKLAKVLFSGVILGIIGYFISKLFKDEVEKVKEQEEERAEELREAGINDPEKFNNVMIPGQDDNDFVKALFLSIDSDPD